MIEPLTYAVTDDSNPGLVSATVAGTNLTVTPLVSFGGTTTLTITATDLDGNTNSQQVNVTVNSPYTGWLTQFGLTGGNTATSADPDGDGIPNGAEFALAGSPNLADAATIRPTNSMVTVTNLKYLALSFKLRTNLSGATVSLRGGPVLNPAGWTNVWTSADLSGPQVLQRLGQSNYYLMTVRDSEPVSPASTNRFLNLRVTTPQ